MNVSFSTVAYFTGCTREKLENLRDLFDSFAEGQENICINMEYLSEIIEEIESGNLDSKELNFLKEVKAELKNRIVGDIIFSL